MKKNTIYIIVGVSVLLLAMVFLGSLKAKEKTLDERITLKIKDKIPYGMYVAYNLLPKLFSSAVISHDKNSPGNWDSISVDDNNKAIFIIAKDFDAEEYELKRLYN